MIKNTPPLGWNSWNTFGEKIDEKVICESAKAMAESGLKDCGYEYVVIDDCWSEKTRDKNGKLKADKNKFPSGMKELTDYIHSLGLKAGIYSCAGPLTCAGYPGSLDCEFEDARTFAEWGFDFLKYDYCFRPTSVKGKFLYRRMGAALANCGRDILFSACSWGIDETHKWIAETGANMWRSTGDVFDTYNSVRDIIREQYDRFPFGGIGCFNDMDMLVTGMNGKGNVGISGCSFEEYKLHMSMWAMLASPLMIGCDIRNLDDATYGLLSNKEMLAVNQDKRGNRAYIANEEEAFINGISPVFARLLENGDFAICFTNLKDDEERVSVNAEQLGVGRISGKKLHLREVWNGEEVVMDNACLCLNMAPHSCKLYRAQVK